MATKEKDPAFALETLPGGVPDLSKPATAARFAEIISAGTLDKLTPAQQSVFLAGLGAYIGIKPELGDLMIYMGKPYITISGYRRIAHNTGLLDGLNPMPASDRDRARYGVKDGEYLWVCHVHKKGTNRPFTGWGHVRLADRNPVAKTHPQEIARKRAVYDGSLPQGVSREGGDMRNRILYALEQLVRFILGEWTAHLPSKLEGWLAEAYYGAINSLRRGRFNVPTTDCECCGFAFPRDDIGLVTLGDGKQYPHCRDCVEFRTFMRAVFAKRPEAA